MFSQAGGTVLQIVLESNQSTTTEYKHQCFSSANQPLDAFSYRELIVTNTEE